MTSAHAIPCRCPTCSLRRDARRLGLELDGALDERAELAALAVAVSSPSRRSRGGHARVGVPDLTHHVGDNADVGGGHRVAAIFPPRAPDLQRAGEALKLAQRHPGRGTLAEHPVANRDLERPRIWLSYAAFRVTKGPRFPLIRKRSQVRVLDRPLVAIPLWHFPAQSEGCMLTTCASFGGTRPPRTSRNAARTASGPPARRTSSEPSDQAT
jgi:hypothetical protein